MYISQENDKKITVQMSPTYFGLMIAGIVIAAGFIVIIAAAGAEPRSGGMSRTPSGGPLILLFVVAPILGYFDWRRNRRSIVMDSVERTVTLIGSPKQTFSFDEIERFTLGADNILGKIASRIDIQLKNGQRISSGVNSDRGNAETTEIVMKKLSDRLRAIPNNEN
jgi:hypothetical protein